MKKDSENNRRRRFIAAVCAVTVLIGGSAGIYAFSANAYAKNDSSDSSSESRAEVKQNKKSDDGIISAGGTVESSQLTDELGLKDTSARLTVEKVLVSAGDAVKSGTQLYQLTADSVAKAKSTLQTELSTAKNALIKQQTSCQADKIKAYSLYQSQLLQGKTAQQEYDSGISSLNSKLKSAYQDYQEANSTVSSTPSEITKKKSELSTKQKAADSLSQKKDETQKKLDDAQNKYESAASSYNSTVTAYNSAASVVRYLGAALGKDVSGIELAQTVSGASQQEQKGSESDRKNMKPSFDPTEQKQQPVNESFPVPPSNTDGQQSQNESQQTQKDSRESQNDGQQTQKDSRQSGDGKKENTVPTGETKTFELSTLYDTAFMEYTAQKQKLDNMNTTLDSAQKEYKTLNEQLSSVSSELSEAQSGISSLEREISELETSLPKAKSSLTKLRSEYESLKASYDTDKLTLKNKLDTDTADSANAKYNYDLTCKTLDSELEKAQSAYDTAAENVSIFDKSLADGYIRAKRDATVDTLNCQAGRNVNISSSVVTYVDTSCLKTTVELDQYDVTQINIGDSAVIYSSETGVTSGRITAIAAGEAKSLADVKFNVTVTADEGSSLYSGQSVNVYFNYSGTDTSVLSDNASEKKSEKDSTSPDKARPDFGGNMPEGFDPSSMPDFGARKEE